MIRILLSTRLGERRMTQSDLLVSQGFAVRLSMSCTTILRSV